MSPGSSESEEHLLFKEEKAAGSNPAPGSNVWLYILIRKELTGGALLAQVAHAASEAASQYTIERGHELPSDTRACVLGCTKEELAKARYDLTADSVSYRAIEETDGALAGVVTAVGLVTLDKAALAPALGGLRPWRAVAK